LAVRTSSSSRSNPSAHLSVGFGVLAAIAVPAAVGAARYLPSVSLLRGLYGGVAVALLLGLLAVGASRRARRALALSLGRAGGEGAARLGRRLAFVGLYLGAMGAIAIGSYTVLRLYS
jgi:hypothetical protein